ncbi:hypothetical protein [Mycoplasma sp. VS1572C]
MQKYFYTYHLGKKEVNMHIVDADLNELQNFYEEWSNGKDDILNFHKNFCCVNCLYCIITTYMYAEDNSNCIKWVSFEDEDNIKFSFLLGFWSDKDLKLNKIREIIEKIYIKHMEELFSFEDLEKIETQNLVYVKPFINYIETISVHTYNINFEEYCENVGRNKLFFWVGDKDLKVIRKQ